MAITFLFCLLCARFFYVQVIWQDELTARALDQWTREIPIVAERGEIYDRNGVLLAGNDTAYTVYARRDILAVSFDVDPSESWMAENVWLTGPAAFVAEIHI